MDTKECTSCNVVKELTEFNFRNREKGLKQYWCRSCKNAYDREAYKTQPDRYSRVNARRKKQKKILGNYVVEYIEEHPCVDCGEEDPIVLEFDHVRGEKYENISNIIRKGACLQTLKDEIEKCEVRCANCHRKKTTEEFGHKRWGVV